MSSTAKGQDGNLGNELADKLARKARVQQIETRNSAMRMLVDIRGTRGPNLGQEIQEA